MITLVQLITAIIGGTICISLLATGIKLFFADKHVYEENKKATRGFKNAALGTVPTTREGSRDYLVHAGMGTRKNGELVALGGLSNEAVSNVLR